MERKRRGEDNSVDGENAVDKWTNRPSVPRGTTGSNRNGIVVSESAILKVPYPYLSQQQLRGKALKRLGIPAAMGSTLSQASAAIGVGTPKNVPKTTDKNERVMSHARKTSQLESDVRIFGRSDEHAAETSANVGPSVNVTAANEKLISVMSDDEETPTPDEVERRSFFSRSTQRFRQDLLLRASQIKSEVITAPTQIVTPNFRFSEKRTAVERVVQEEMSMTNRGDRRSNAAIGVSPICSQIVSPAELPSQIDVETVDANFGGNDFFPRKMMLSPLEGKTRKTESPSPTRSSNSAGSGGEKATASTPFDTIDINDLTQLPTPGTDHFRIRLSSTSLSRDTTSSGCSRSGFGQSSEILARKIAEINLKRKRNANVLTNDDGGDEENDPAKENFRGEKNGTRILAVNAYSKDQLDPRRSENPSMALRNRYDENVLSSEDESPKAKKPRFVTEDCGLTPFPSRRRKKAVQFSDADDSTSDQRASNLRESGDNSTGTLVASQKEKPKEKSSFRKSTSSFTNESGSSRSRSHVNFDDEISPSFLTKDCGLTPHPSRRTKKSVQFPDVTDEVDVTSVQRDSDIRENRKNLLLTPAAKLERKSSLRKSTSLSSDEIRASGLRSHLDFGDEVSPSYVTVDCGSTPFQPRDKKKNVEFSDANDEEKATRRREASDVNENEKNPSTLPVANQEERSTSRCVKEKREARRHLDFGDEETSPSFVTKNCGLTPFYPRNSKKNVQFIDLDDEENATSLRGDCTVDENEKKPIIELITLVSSLEEKLPSCSTEDIRVAIKDDDVCAREATGESSVLILDDDCRDKSPLKSEDAEKQIIIVSNDVCDSKAIAVESTNVLFDERDGISSHKSASQEKPFASSTTVVNDVCDNIPAVESSGIVLDDDHNEESSDSASTYFSGAEAAKTLERREFLSDFCCEYDQSFQSEKAQELIKNSTRLSSFVDNFKVSTAEINRKVKEILIFLETDIENN